MSHNLSRLFYISGDKKPVKEQNDIKFIREIREFNKNIPDIRLYESYFRAENANEFFELTTIYPGLLLGAGYSHPALKKVDNSNPHEKSDFQLGFFFDHTTGLPVIPGSSIKGVLKRVFPQKNDRYKEEKLEYIKETLKKVDNKIDENLINYDNWEEIFFGNVAKKRKHIFFDAYISELPENNRLFEDDYITSHTEGIFKNPNPIRFLKVGPGVKFKFQFRLCDYTDVNKNVLLSSNQISEVFKQILLDFGVGAKRNVGYGQFIDGKNNA